MNLYLDDDMAFALGTDCKKVTAMTIGELEERVAALEREVAELKGQFGPSDPRRRWWLEDAGRFADDPVFEEIIRLGRQYRQSLRPTARKRKP